VRLETERLILRPWKDRDRPHFAAINRDPEVRRYYYPSILSQPESDEAIDWCIAHLREHGFGFVAAERRSDGALIGGIGFSRTGPELPASPAIEIGWIFGSQYWGQGLGYEAATACLRYGWAKLGLREVIGYTSAINPRSRKLMEKLGMRRDPAEDFEDVTVPPGNELRPHVLYRIVNPAG
jgi:RimJ/RimL family protein N-acetyltransferase